MDCPGAGGVLVNESGKGVLAKEGIAGMTSAHDYLLIPMKVMVLDSGLVK
jgi:hypothetical protein